MSFKNILSVYFDRRLAACQIHDFVPLKLWFSGSFCQKGYEIVVIFTSWDALTAKNGY